MQLILSYTDYIERLENSFLYEDIINSQRILNSLFYRDKSKLISYQKVHEQLVDVVEKDSLSLKSKEQKEFKLHLLEIIQNWNLYLENIDSVSRLILLANQHGHLIEHQTLKIIHYAYQNMSINEIRKINKDLFRLIKQNLQNIDVDFSSYLLPEQQKLEDKQSEKKFYLVKEKPFKEEQHQVEKKRKDDSEQLIEEQRLKDIQKKQSLNRQSLEVDLNIQKMFCTSCQKFYPQHYLTCLRCGSKLVQNKI